MRIRTILCASLLAFTATSAQALEGPSKGHSTKTSHIADTRDGMRVVDQKAFSELQAEMLRWIGDNSPYDVSDLFVQLPTVAFCNHGATYIYKGNPLHFGNRLAGVYDDVAEQICLAKPWDINNKRDQSVLLHELVHFVQFRSKGWFCPQKTEWEAYKLQEAWMKENGLEPNFNWAFILLESSCGVRDRHP